MSDIINYAFNSDGVVNSKLRNRKALHPKLEDAMFIDYNEKFLMDPKNILIIVETMIELSRTNLALCFKKPI